MAKKFVYKNVSSLWGGLFCGSLLIGISAYNLLTIKGDGYMSWKGVYVPVWENWFLLLAGIVIIAPSLYDLMRGKDKPESCAETYTDKETAQAEAEMDAMYFRQYGELPEKPKPEKITPEESEKNAE